MRSGAVMGRSLMLFPGFVWHTQPYETKVGGLRHNRAGQMTVEKGICCLAHRRPSWLTSLLEVINPKGGFSC
jgi:hypothetical protein